MDKSSETYFGLAGMGFAILLVALLVVIIVQLMKVWQTKIQTKNEESYYKIATDAIEVQKKSVLQQENLDAELREVKERLASIEKILKEVE